MSNGPATATPATGGHAADRSSAPFLSPPPPRRGRGCPHAPRSPREDTGPPRLLLPPPPPPRPGADARIPPTPHRPQPTAAAARTPLPCSRPAGGEAAAELGPSGVRSGGTPVLTGCDQSSGPQRREAQHQPEARPPPHPAGLLRGRRRREAPTPASSPRPPPPPIRRPH